MFTLQLYEGWEDGWADLFHFVVCGGPRFWGWEVGGIASDP